MMFTSTSSHKIGDLPLPSEGLDGRRGGATSAAIGDREHRHCRTLFQTTPEGRWRLADFLSEELPRRFSSGKWRPATRIQLPRNALDLLDRSFDLNESFGQGRTQADQFRHRLS